jgi:hypothetical protein
VVSCRDKELRAAAAAGIGAAVSESSEETEDSADDLQEGISTNAATAAASDDAEAAAAADEAVDAAAIAAESEAAAAAAAAAEAALAAPGPCGESCGSAVPYLVALLQCEEDETPDVDLVELIVQLLSGVVQLPREAGGATGALLQALCSRWVVLHAWLFCLLAASCLCV